MNICHIPNVVVSHLTVIRGANVMVSHCDDEEKKVRSRDAGLLPDIPIIMYSYIQITCPAMARECFESLLAGQQS